MNAQRRKELKNIQNELENVTQRIQDLIDQEQEAFDNMPESLQGSERGEEMEQNISPLADIRSQIDDASSDVSYLI